MDVRQKPTIRLFGDEGPELAVPCPLRALLYVSKLREAHEVLTSESDERIATALDDPRLLAALARILDDFVTPGLVAEVNDALQAYEDTKEEPTPPWPFSPDATTSYQSCLRYYGDHPGELFERNPFIARTIKRLTEYFLKNIRHACASVLNDWSAIQKYFFPNNELVRLERIKVSGSDSHKRGKQVLFLTFRAKPEVTLGASILSVFAFNKKQEINIEDCVLLKLVFKPSDLERDYRIVGDVAWARKVMDGLGVPQIVKDLAAISVLPSLAEIMSEDGPQIPRYKILPCFPGSTLSDTSEIGASYGYIEFLSFDRKAPPELDAYFRRLGMLAAMLMVAGVTDIHQDNLILHDGAPHLIDLEMAYFGLMTEYEHTSFSGAIFETGKTEGARVVRVGQRVTFTSDLEPEHTANSLGLDGGSHLLLAKKLQPEIAKGFALGMKLLRARGQAVMRWLAECGKVIVRLIPETTGKLRGMLEWLHDAKLHRIRGEMRRIVTDDDFVDACLHDAWTDLNAGLEKQRERWITYFGTMQKELVQLDKRITACREKRGINPRTDDLLFLRGLWSSNYVAPWHCVWASGAIAQDFLHGDIPAVYHRLCTTSVVSSLGITIFCQLRFDETLESECRVVEELLGSSWGETFLPMPTIDVLMGHFNRMLVDDEYFNLVVALGSWRLTGLMV